MHHATTPTVPADHHRPVADAAYAGRTAGRRVARTSADARMRITRRTPTW